MSFLFISLMNIAMAQDGASNPIEEFIVQGEVQKPNVFLVINKNNTSKSYELELRESFIPKILESMKKEPL